MLEGLDHITINVTDMEKSIEFYGEVLGLPRLPDIMMEDHRLVYFQIGNTKLELIQYFFDTPRDANKLLNTGKYRHIAFAVEGIEQLNDKLRKHGICVLQEPRWNERLQFTGMLFLDPNGCEIEFVERK